MLDDELLDSSTPKIDLFFLKLVNGIKGSFGYSMMFSKSLKKLFSQSAKAFCPIGEKGVPQKIWLESKLTMLPGVLTTYSSWPDSELNETSCSTDDSILTLLSYLLVCLVKFWLSLSLKCSFLSNSSMILSFLGCLKPASAPDFLLACSCYLTKQRRTPILLLRLAAKSKPYFSPMRS